MISISILKYASINWLIETWRSLKNQTIYLRKINKIYNQNNILSKRGRFVRYLMNNLLKRNC